MMAGAGRTMFAQLLLALTLTAFVQSANARIRVVDDAGQTLVFAAPVKRIVSAAPHITELLFAAGAGDKIVGTVRFSDFPESAKAIPLIGDSNGLDLERIVALEPDVIIAWLSGGGTLQLQRLRTLGIPIYLSEPRTFGDISSSLIRFGQLTGSEAAARAVAQSFSARIESLRDRYARLRPVSVFYQAWTRPLITISGEHLISDVIRLCGGINVFAALQALTAVVGAESVLAAHPDAVVTTDDEEPAAREFWDRFKSVDAKLIVLDGDTIARHTPRIADGASALCEQLEAVRAAGHSNKK